MGFSVRLSWAMPRGLGVQGGGFLLKTLAASEHKVGSHPSWGSPGGDGPAGKTYPNLQGCSTGLWPPRSRLEESWGRRKSVSLGSASSERLKIFPTARAKFICQSPEELIPASVWKCQPVWLEERKQSFPLNSRKHMGTGLDPSATIKRRVKLLK